ncbi:hypothetical protein GIB67_002080 [Kingdonia uniflora]|uniref:Uncharacterized protein n=1 Tax=Kingdonia uniflora TaxID=39325 RepID=A0A7J7KWC5_9MAGN|nr:hypothetical protein GIB67_002080 [Kingdonia uniflora]
MGVPTLHLFVLVYLYNYGASIRTISLFFLGLLGSVAPCVLYGSNVERLGGSGTEHFANHCLPYSGLYLLGNSLFGWNLMAPWFSYPSRTAIRRKFNLEASTSPNYYVVSLMSFLLCISGFLTDDSSCIVLESTFFSLPFWCWLWEQGSCEAFSRSCGCCGDIVEDEVQLENWETTCDFMTHFFCHTCSLCQEGRELRRRLPHPGFNSRSVMVMIPPPEQAMGRDGA